jgi:chromosomal replication initiation ATPase DnaA
MAARRPSGPAEAVAGSQLILELGHRPALGREDFLVAPGNQVAVDWIDRWPDWPQPGLALCGDPGSGKTHLTHVWRSRSGAIALEPRALFNAHPPELLGDAAACVLDHAEGLWDPAALQAGAGGALRPGEGERHLLHVFNMIVERGGHILFAGRSAPARWPIALPDLRSRLAALPAVALGPPDEQLIEAVLVKLFADRQLAVEPAVVRYLLRRMERSFAAARGLVAAIDRESLRAGRQVTVPFVSELMARSGFASDGGGPAED